MQALPPTFPRYICMDRECDVQYRPRVGRKNREFAGKESEERADGQANYQQNSSGMKSAAVTTDVLVLARHPHKAKHPPWQNEN